jgi:hypothetical protein
MQGLGSGPISLFGSEELKGRVLPRVAKGEAIAAFALSEPEAGSDVAALATAATPDGPAHVRLDGVKTWISNGGIADVYVVFARTGEAPGARGLSAFLVEADAPGLSIAERIEVIAPHPLATLRFEGCRVPLSQRIGGPGEGFKIAMATLDVFRSTSAPPPSVSPGAPSMRLWTAPAPAACSARPWATSSSRKRRSPRWRPRSTPPRFSSTAPLGRRTAALPASPARRRWPRCTPPKPRKG